MLELLKVNLQLFADDDQEDVVDSQDVSEMDDIGEVESEPNFEDDEIPFDDEGDGDSDISEEQEVADPEQKKQSPQENAQYKKMRLRAYREAKEKIEKEFEEEKKRVQQLRLQMEQDVAEKKIINEHMSSEKVAELAYDEGVSEEVARRILRAETQRIIEVEKQKVQQKFFEVQEQKKALQSKKYFKYVEKDVDALVEQNPNVSYEMAYKFIVGDKIDELEKIASKDTEKRTIANLHDRSRRRNVSGSDGGSDYQVAPSNIVSKDGLEMANVFGVDPRELAKYVKNNTRKKKG